jgi:ribosomal-protein-alanine N-acetyltransferase
VSRRIAPLPPNAAAPLAEMHRCCFPEDPWDADAVGRVMTLSGVFGYVGWEGDAPAGFILARDLGDEAEILSLGVLPQWRRHGMGRALLAAVIAQAEARRIGSLVLEVATDNDAARRLYGGTGFIQVGRRPRYYRRTQNNGDGLILRRGITSEARLR